MKLTFKETLKDYIDCGLIDVIIFVMPFIVLAIVSYNLAMN